MKVEGILKLNLKYLNISVINVIITAKALYEHYTDLL